MSDPDKWTREAREIAHAHSPCAELPDRDPEAHTGQCHQLTYAIAALAKRAHDAGAEGALEPGVAEIAAERRRQREVEGWTEAHDDEHVNREIAKAAACYALWAGDIRVFTHSVWPWNDAWWKPKDHLRNLERAGALVAAEIARLKRASTKAGA